MQSAPLTYRSTQSRPTRLPLARLFAVLLPSAVFLSACTEVEQTTTALARKSASAAVDEVLVTRFPGVDGTRVTPFTNCVINGASGREIASLASAAVVGVDEKTVTLVVDIAKRPAVAACLVQAGLTA